MNPARRSDFDAPSFPPQPALEEPPETSKRRNEAIGTTGARPCKPPVYSEDYSFDDIPVGRAQKRRWKPPAPVDLADGEEDVVPAPPGLDPAVRAFMTSEGPKLSVNDISTLSDQVLIALLAQVHPAFLVNLDSEPEKLAAAGLLDQAVFTQYKKLSLPLHRYLLDRVCAEWFAKLRTNTQANYLNGIHRFYAAQQQPALPLTLPYDGVATAIDGIIQSSVDAGKMHNPRGTLSVYSGGLTRLAAIQLGIPQEQRPVAGVIKNKNDGILAIEQQCSNGGSAWKLLTQKWSRFKGPNKRVAAVLKNSQAKLISGIC